MTTNRLTAFEYKRLTSIMIRIVATLLLVFIFLALGVNIKYDLIETKTYAEYK